MEILNILEALVNYIETNILDEIDLNTFSKSFGINEYELSNLFHSLTGMTIKEYIRKRRLTLAAYDLQNHSNKVIDVAVKYGYESSDSFRRAFYSQHNINPSDVKNSNVSLNIYPPISFKIDIKGADKMNFKIVEAEKREVYGISTPCYSSDDSRYKLAKELWSEDSIHIPEKICDGYDGIWYGIWNNSSYTIARDKSNCTVNELEKVIIPAGKYAVFTTDKGGYAGDVIPKLHSQIYDCWLPQSDYVASSDFELEVYHLASDRATRRKQRYYEIWVPVKHIYENQNDNQVVIRQANENDAEAICKIACEDLGYSCTPEIVEKTLSSLSKDNQVVYVAQVDNEVVGFVHIQLYNLLYCNSGSNILGLAVNSKYQRQGIGKKLLEQAESWAKENGASFVRLNSGGNRKGAHNFYRSVGYDNEKQQIRFMKMI